MAKKYAGEYFDLASDQEILGINSPQDNVIGPYVVIYKDLNDRWAIVALDWMKEPSLGIRWFYGSSGTPASRGYATWLIIPELLREPILSGLPINQEFRDQIEYFLAGKIVGNRLIEFHNRHPEACYPIIG